jgi:hypothetical protein
MSPFLKPQKAMYKIVGKYRGKAMYKIVGKYRGKVEVLDRARDLREAEYLAREYSIAFGPEWSISIIRRGRRA